MSWWASANQFVESNQGILTAVGIPLLTLLVGLVVGILTYWAKVTDRRLNARLRLSEYRRENLRDLEAHIGELMTLFAEVQVSMHEKGDEGTLTYDHFKVALAKANQSLLKVRANPQSINALQEAFGRQIQYLISGDEDEKKKEPSPAYFNRVCIEVVENEWRNIEDDLRKLA